MVVAPLIVAVPEIQRFEILERCPTVVFPTTDKVFEMVVAPPTESVPAIPVLPVTSAIVNTVESQENPPFAATAPTNVVTPPTDNVPVIVVLLINVAVPATLKFEMSERCPTVVFPTTERVVERVTAPERVVAPVTDNVPVTLKFPPIVV
jgi:hypothetical protein